MVKRNRKCLHSGSHRISLKDRSRCSRYIGIYLDGIADIKKFESNASKCVNSPRKNAKSTKFHNKDDMEGLHRGQSNNGGATVNFKVKFHSNFNSLSCKMLSSHVYIAVRKWPKSIPIHSPCNGILNSICFFYFTVYK